MENWQSIIDNKIKESINLDAFAKIYLKEILKNKSEGKPENFAIKMAKIKMADALKQQGIQASHITHLLHFCGMVIYPRMYSGCGCHDYLRNRHHA